MKEGMKMGGFFISIIIVALVVCCGIVYVRKVEERSFSSYLMERLLFLFVKPLTYSKGKADKFEQEFNKWAKGNDEPIANPKKYIKVDVQEKDVDGMQVFMWNDKKDANQKVILFLHGGAYVLQPLMGHFTLVNKIAQAIDAKVVFPIYPKAPKHQYRETYEKLEKLYRGLLEEHTNPNSIIFMGDSAGGGLSLGFAIYLKELSLPQPKELVLFSPWVDIATDNPEIALYEPFDPILKQSGIHEVAKLWAGDDLKQPLVSPLFGDLSGLGRISIYIGTHDILYPDNRLLHEKLLKEGIEHRYIEREKMNHVYVGLPIKEARKDIQELIEELKK